MIVTTKRGVFYFSRPVTGVWVLKSLTGAMMAGLLSAANVDVLPTEVEDPVWENIVVLDAKKFTRIVGFLFQDVDYSDLITAVAAGRLPGSQSAAIPAVLASIAAAKDAAMRESIHPAPTTAPVL
jgi:hypothetical protein